MTLKFLEVIKTYEFEPIPTRDSAGESFRFRVEILKRFGSTDYLARLYRRETFRLQPTFPQHAGKPMEAVGDHEIEVLDDLFAEDSFRADSIDKVLDKVGEKIAEIFQL